jgi:hypothetical protein
MMDKQRFKTLVDELIGHAYDTGYYSGKKQDGLPHHMQAIDSRVAARRKVIEAFDALCDERDAARKSEPMEIPF